MRSATAASVSARTWAIVAGDGARRGALPAVPQPASRPVPANDPALVYVPNSLSNTVDVIDQKTFKIVGHFKVGRRPQHVTPSYDLKTLYVDSDLGNSLQAIDPATGRPIGGRIPVADPY